MSDDLPNQTRSDIRLVYRGGETYLSRVDLVNHFRAEMALVEANEKIPEYPKKLVRAVVDEFVRALMEAET